MGGSGAVPAAGQGTFPARLDSYFTRILKLTTEERRVLLAGAPLAKNLEAYPGRQVAVFGAIWINAPMARYVAALQNIENFERAADFVSRRRSATRTPPGL